MSLPVRPTWDVIIRGFASGRFHFHGTDKRAVAKFAESIDQLPQTSVRPEPVMDVDAVLSRLDERLKAAIAVFDVGECNDTDDQSAVASLSSALHPRFDWALRHFEATLRPSQFDVYYKAIAVYFKSADELAMDKCLR
jgi:hypothetical protein